MKVNDGWSPYVAGALVGLLAVVSVYLTSTLTKKTHFFGTSTTFVRIAGFIERAFVPEYVEKNEYFKKTKLHIEWQFMFVVGIFIGAFISSRTDGSFKVEWVPPTWEKAYGSSKIRRALAAFLGGIIAMFGARLADGCPSGHGLSGMMQLSLSALPSLMLFFACGVIFAHILYRKVLRDKE